jgi:hypothetical protein
MKRYEEMMPRRRSNEEELKARTGLPVTSKEPEEQEEDNKILL